MSIQLIAQTRRISLSGNNPDLIRVAYQATIHLVYYRHVSRLLHPRRNESAANQFIDCPSGTCRLLFLKTESSREIASRPNRITDILPLSNPENTTDFLLVIGYESSLWDKASLGYASVSDYSVFEGCNLGNFDRRTIKLWHRTRAPGANDRDQRESSFPKRVE